VGESSGEITVRITSRFIEPDQAARAAHARQQQQFLQRQMQISRNPNLVQRLQQLQQLQQDVLRTAPPNLFKIKEVTQNVDFVLADGARVRTVLPAEAFDDKGNVKTYTKEELAALKGDPKLPGYTADRDALEVDRPVLVVVARKASELPGWKGKAKVKEGEPSEEKGSAIDKMPKEGQPGKPLVSLILVGQPVVK
jgi:hypothetical protein